MNRSGARFNFRGVSNAEIKAHIRELKNNTDEYSVNRNVLSDVFEKMGIFIANLINDSLSFGVFPSTQEIHCYPNS